MRFEHSALLVHKSKGFKTTTIEISEIPVSYTHPVCFARYFSFVFTCRVSGTVKYWSCHEWLEVQSEQYALKRSFLKKAITLPWPEACWSKCNNKQLFKLRNKRRGRGTIKTTSPFLIQSWSEGFSPLESNSTKVNSVCHQLRLQPQENRLSRFIQICNYVISRPIINQSYVVRWISFSMSESWSKTLSSWNQAKQIQLTFSPVKSVSYNLWISLKLFFSCFYNRSEPNPFLAREC